MLNNPVLYKESAQAVAHINQFTGELAKSKGALGTLMNDPAFKADLQKIITNLKEATAQLPGLMQKADAFLKQLQRAGKGLPGLVNSGETMVNDVDQAAKAAKKSWLLRGNIPKAKERTLLKE